MLRKARSRLTFADTVVPLALFIALGGTGAAEPIADTASLATAPALAANQTVTATQFSTFVERDVTIIQGESVTWNNAGGSHNVHFDDGSFDMPAVPSTPPWSVSHTFGQVGTYRYYCELHGGSGGIGMSGTVVVIASDFTPLVSVASSPALSNSTSITINYSASDGSGSGVKEVELWVQRPGDAGSSLAATDTTPASPSFTYSALAGDGNYRFYTRARDNAGNYEDPPTSPPDSTTLVDTPAPAPPIFIATDPSSPANDNNPKLKGSAELNSTVKLYTNLLCSGNPVAVGPAAAFASPGLPVAVGDNSTTTFYATATDQANVSVCSLSSITYVENSTPAPSGGGIQTGGAGGAGVTDKSAPVMTIAIDLIQVRSDGVIRIPLSCPASEPGGCAGTLSLETLTKVRVTKLITSRRPPRKRKVKLGTTSFQIGGGKTAAVKIRLSKKNQRLVRKLKKVRVLAIIAVRDQAGNTETRKKTLILRAKKKPLR